MGVLFDDRLPSFEGWIAEKPSDLAPAIRATVEAWLRRLRDGGPRSKPRAIETVWQYANNAHPVLLAWSAHVDHLREIIRDDVPEALSAQSGGERQHVLIALRSLFAFAKKAGAVFRNPTAGLKVGGRISLLPLPQPERRIEATAQAACSPVERLVLVLAALHAARTGQIRALLLGPGRCTCFPDWFGLDNRIMAGQVHLLHISRLDRSEAREYRRLDAARAVRRTGSVRTTWSSTGNGGGG
jgi:hypothetical protein